MECLRLFKKINTKKLNNEYIKLNNLFCSCFYLNSDFKVKLIRNSDKIHLCFVAVF